MSRGPRDLETSPAATLASQLLTPYARELQKAGPAVDAQARYEAGDLFAQMGLTMGNVEALRIRLPHRVVIVLLAQLAEITGDSAFSLRAAEGSVLGDFEPYDYLCRHCATLGDSIRAARDYMPLMHDGVIAELLIDDDRVLWRNRLMSGLEPSAAINEFTTASLLASARRYTGIPLTAAEVTLAHPRPPHAEQLEAFFGCPIRFDASHNSFLMPKIGLDVPILDADPVLGGVLRRHADDLMRTLPARRPFTHSVTDLIAQELESSGASLKQLARLMHMSESTLRRRLSEEGRTHSEIVDTAREQLARRYLADPSQSLADVAQRLGFAHAPAFHRAFKRWTGMTPAQFRTARADSGVARFLKRD